MRSPPSPKACYKTFWKLSECPELPFLPFDLRNRLSYVFSAPVVRQEERMKAVQSAWEHRCARNDLRTFSSSLNPLPFCF
jgi:hypothetical protein